MISFKKLSSFLFVAAFVAAFGPVSGASAQAAQISWTACPLEDYPTLQCGTFEVPYDYGKPNGKKFTLALQKLPASGTKTGTLFANPGGPGSPGLNSWFFASDSQSLRESFDLVGFDPRGIGETKPAFDCEAPQFGPTNNPNIDWVAFSRAVTPLIARANRACQRKSADFIAHVGTNNVVRDLDAMRAAVGDAKLTYWGMSYGTRIGYTYAYRYPQRVRAIILDGPVTPNGSWANFARVRSGSNDEALRFIRSVSPSTYAAVISTRNSLFASRQFRCRARQRARIVRNVVSRAPVIGGLLASSTVPSCTGFTFRPDPVPRIASRASLARVRNVKLAISDSTADAATPLVWGRAMARAFPSAFEVTQETGNHVNYLSTESDCVDDPLREYLLTLKMAPRRTTCLFTAPEGLDMSAVAAGKRKLN
jgi:pimeloyl-ACP methyl ester carboxylesterase